MISEEKIPSLILEKYPEVLSIHKALDEHRAGQVITARCSTCGQTLVVTDFQELGSLWVGCETGCTNFHLKYTPIVKEVVSSN